MEGVHPGRPAGGGSLKPDFSGVCRTQERGWALLMDIHSSWPGLNPQLPAPHRASNPYAFGWFPSTGLPGLLPLDLARCPLLGPQSQKYTDNPYPTTMGQPLGSTVDSGWESCVSRIFPCMEGLECGWGECVGGSRGLWRLKVSKSASGSQAARALLGRGLSWGSLSITVPLGSLRTDDLPQAQLWVLVPGAGDADSYLSCSSHATSSRKSSLITLEPGWASLLCAPSAGFTVNHDCWLLRWLRQ